METLLEDNLFQKIVAEDQEGVSQLLLKGANPNKITRLGKTSLGEAAKLGNTDIVKLLIDASKTDKYSYKMVSTQNIQKKRQIKSQKRKLKSSAQNDEMVVKCKNLNDRTMKTSKGPVESTDSADDIQKDRNQGYFVIIHSDGSSSDESKINSLKSPLSPPSLVTSPQADLEWDEDIGNFAPTTSEDETWSSMYRWYAAILENTGAAIAAASVVTSGVDQQDAFMRTALHYASEHGHIEVVKQLIDAGCKVDITAGNGLTSLHVAVTKNHTEIVKHLLASGSHVNYKTHEKMTPLHFAASRGFLELVKILITNGAYIEARDTNERTALYLAAGRGHVDVVKYLISVGANVNGEEIHGYTPLCEAVWQRCTDIVEVLLRAGARITHSHKLLHNAIIQRQEQIVKLFADLAGGINLTNDNGDTPLLLAARLSQPNIIYTLLQRGASINTCNSFTGINALHVLVESIDCPKEFEEVLVFLLKHKIDMNATSLTGDTALNRALLLQRDHAAMMLIRHGANVNAGDLHSRGIDNLSIASKRRTPNLASMLLKAGHCPLMSDATIVLKPESTALWVFNACRNPLRLADLCRIRIRLLCKNKPMFAHIDALPLPSSLKKFLMMEDESVPLSPTTS
ncbi:uncharacterized protein [Epargyreus clarus]|uniref:uncharacterized protein n=1 Tax=Epargyreus clarus TaxID=520877 RepID=UPI003C2C8A0A